MKRTWQFLVPLIVLLLLLPVASALAADAGTADPTPPTHLLLPTDQLWAILASSTVALPTYLLNHYGPHVSELAKGLVLTITTAVAAGITQAITAGNVGFNQTTLQFIVTGVVAAFAAHKIIWQPTGAAALFKAGTNKRRHPPARPPSR